MFTHEKKPAAIFDGKLYVFELYLCDPQNPVVRYRQADTVTGEVVTVDCRNGQARLARDLIRGDAAIEAFGPLSDRGWLVPLVAEYGGDVLRACRVFENHAERHDAQQVVIEAPDQKRLDFERAKAQRKGG